MNSSRVTAFTLQPPSNPPTATDVAHAVQYTTAVVDAQKLEQGPNTKGEDVAAVAECQAPVITASNLNWQAVVPSLLQIQATINQMMIQLNRRFDSLNGGLDRLQHTLDEGFAGVKGRLTGVEGQLVGIQEKMTEVGDNLAIFRNDVATVEDWMPKFEVERISSIAYNRQVLTSATVSYQEVPFPDGSYPTKAPHNLPLINSTEDADAMSEHDLEEYPQNYYPLLEQEGSARAGGRMDRAQRTQEVFMAIGCRALPEEREQ